ELPAGPEVERAVARVDVAFRPLQREEGVTVDREVVGRAGLPDGARLKVGVDASALDAANVRGPRLGAAEFLHQRREGDAAGAIAGRRHVSEVFGRRLLPRRGGVDGGGSAV